MGSGDLRKGTNTFDTARNEGQAVIARRVGGVKLLAINCVAEALHKRDGGEGSEIRDEDLRTEYGVL